MIRVSTAIRGYSGVQQRGWSFKGAGDSGVQRRTAAWVVFQGCGRFGGTAAYAAGMVFPEGEGREGKRKEEGGME